MLQAVADGESNPATVAALGSQRLRATPDQLCDALGACTDLDPIYRRLLAMTLGELQLIEAHIQQLDEELARLLRAHQDAVQRLAAVPGLGVDSAQQIIAEVGPTAATFPSAKRLSSWMGACPGQMKARASITAIARHMAIGKCAGFSIKPPMPRSRLRAVSSSWCIVDWSCAWDTRKPSARLPIGSAASCGRYCTRASYTRNVAPPSPNSERTDAPPR